MPCTVTGWISGFSTMPCWSPRGTSGSYVTRRMNMSNRHKHAAMMLKYARDAAERPDPWTLWQTKIPGEGWVDLTDNPAWYEHTEYRRRDGVKVRPAFYRDQTRYQL